MPLTARLMSRGMSDPPAVTTRSRGALNTGDGGLCSKCRDAACASGGCGGDGVASAIADFIGATKRKTRERDGRRKNCSPLPPNPIPGSKLQTYALINRVVYVGRPPALGSGSCILLPRPPHFVASIMTKEVQI